MIADPPQYDEPERTPPFLDLVAATPSPSRVIVRDRNTNPTVLFDIPVRSEDNDEMIYYALHVNYTFPDHNNYVAFGRLPAGTFDETGRAIQIDWDARRIGVGAPRGCYQLTLLVAHESSWDYTLQRPNPTLGIGDTAVATWWLNLDPRAESPDTLDDCPNASEVEQ